MVSLVTISYILFVKSFLNLKYVLPKSVSYLKIGICIFSVNAILSVFYRSHQLAKFMEVITFSMSIYLFNLAYIAWMKKGYKPARFFVLAIFSLTLSSILLLLQRIGVDFYFKIGVFRPDNIGVVLFMTLMSFALGDRINILSKEKAEAQEKALEILEEKVAERTREALEKSKIIEEKNKDILASILYARRIQKAQLPTEKYLNKILSRLKR